MYIYIYVYIHLYIHTYIYVPYIYIHTYMYICVYTNCHQVSIVNGQRNCLWGWIWIWRGARGARQRWRRQRVIWGVCWVGDGTVRCSVLPCVAVCWCCSQRGVRCSTQPRELMRVAVCWCCSQVVVRCCTYVAVGWCCTEVVCSCKGVAVCWCCSHADKLQCVAARSCANSCMRQWKCSVLQ